MTIEALAQLRRRTDGWRTLRTGTLRAVAAVICCCADAAAAFECGEVPRSAAADFDRTLEVAGRGELQLAVPLGRAGWHLVLVMEDGIDVTAFVGATQRPTDSPVPRRGMQRVVVEAPSP